ncbi:sigma 54 modulation/S30EA ribosomal C-terminal domain-containing protein [Mycolicibacterium phlei]
MVSSTDSTTDVIVTVRGHLPGAAEYARDQIAALLKQTGRPVLQARVKLTRHGEPDTHPVIAQANLDVDGRLVRAQVEGHNVREAVDRLEARLKRRLHDVAGPREARRHAERRSERQYVGIPAEERQIVRHKSFAPPRCTIDEAVWDLEMLDYDFYLFVEDGSGIAGVLYHDGDTGYRLAQVAPATEVEHAPSVAPLSLSPAPAPCITVEQARERMELVGLPFLFFVDAEQGRASVLYRRYDGHYGLISPAG